MSSHKIGTKKKFGDFIIELQERNHAVIRHKKGIQFDPTFYEMQYIKDLIFGGTSTAIEIFPSHKNLIDGQHQRHLWLIDSEDIPNLNSNSKSIIIKDES